MGRTAAYWLLFCSTAWAAPSTPSAVGPPRSSGTEVKAAARLDLHECRTRSSRPFAEIVAAFADDQTPNLPAKAVTIHAGEQLCIVGTPTAQGQLVELRVVPSASAGNWMSFQLEIRDGSTTLRVQHGGRRPMRYSAAGVATELDLALRTRTVPAQPGVASHESWPAPIHRFVLFGFTFFELEVPASRKQIPWTRSFPGEEGKMPIIGLTAGLGEAYAQLIDLERVLVAEGYSTLPSIMTIFTFGVEGVFGPVRVGLPIEGGWMATRHRHRDEELSLRVLGGGFLVGYDFLRLPGSSTFVAARVNWSSLSVDADAMRSAFGEQLAGLDEDDLVEGSFSALSLELGHDRYFSLGHLTAVEQAAILFGFRIGYNWQLGGTEWSTADEDDRDLKGGPALDFSGARFRFVLGLVID